MEAWIHYYVVNDENISLPVQNKGPHYNRRQYNTADVMKGRRSYESAKKVKTFLKGHYAGVIIRDDDDYIVWQYDPDKLPKDPGIAKHSIHKAKYSVFKRVTLEMPTIGDDDGEED
jgi:hypothetical protein